MPSILKNKLLWGLLAVAAMTLLGLLQGGMGLEWVGYGFGRSLAPKRAPNPQVAVVAIDAAALKQYGPWPWPRDVLAKLVDVLSDDKAGVIALTEDLSAPQNAAALDYLTQIQALNTTGDPIVNAKLAEAQTALDTDDALLASLARSGKVMLAARGTRLSSAGAQSQGGGAPSFALSLDVPAAPAVALDAPLLKFTNASRGVGFLDQDVDETPVRPLLVQSAGHAVPALALLMAAREQDIELSRLGVQGLGGVTLGDSLIRTDLHMQVLMQPNADAIPRYGFAEVVAGTVPGEKLAGKVVLVGRVEAGAHAPVLDTAALVSGLLNG